MAKFVAVHVQKLRLLACLHIPFLRIISHHYRTSSLTQQEVAAALRPFYFAVHPDLFWQFPKEKEINENSLKILNSYLETLLNNQPPSPTSITFCLRNTRNKIDQINSPTDFPFKRVNIQLHGRDIRCTVHKVLTSCQLPTQYLDALNGEKPEKAVPVQKQQVNEKGPPNFAQAEAESVARDIEERIRNDPVIDCRTWLLDNITEAQRRLKSCQALREETERLRNELRIRHDLTDILWNCGWGITHFRGCLLSLKTLGMQHSKEMTVLKDRTIIFGRQTGVSFEGHIILSSEDVRTNWLNMVCAVDHFDSMLQQLPDAEKALSEVLRGIVIDHRKFQPTVLVQKYVQQLGKLTSALYKYKWHNGYPESWPRRLDNFQIVVECEAGPLMLSPTGQFIVPASCPAFLLVDFISKNMAEASVLLEDYTTMKAKECEVYTKCMAAFGLSSLEKDDNVTPDLMVKCCERLLEQTSAFSYCLRDLRLRISHYYSVLQDGDICIPWDWKQFCS